MSTSPIHPDAFQISSPQQHATPAMSPIKAGHSDVQMVYKIVLTGGPCAGKTTALARLSRYFCERGFRVFLVPEAATILQMGGVSPMEFTDENHIKNFQWQLLQLQITLENSFVTLAADVNKPTLILCDRGAMDGSAYMPPELWEDLKAEHDLDTVTLRDTRYNAVFHLITAAQGAEQYYSCANNAARSESAAFAREIDVKTCQAWVGHPKLYVFDNSTNFEEKMQRLVSTAARLVGLPSTVKASRKFRLTSAPFLTSLPKPTECFSVDKVYLTPSPTDIDERLLDYSFVRCRSQFGLPAYGMTTVRHLASGACVELKRVLTAREYAYAVKHRADPSRRVIKQTRFCFLYKNQSFQIHVYKEPVSKAGMAIVHVQMSSEESLTHPLEMPPCLTIAQELQDDDTEYSAYKMSLDETLDCKAD